MTGGDAHGNEGRKYIILAIVLTGVFMSVLDSVVVNIALPNITTNFLVRSPIRSGSSPSTWWCRPAS